MGGDVYFSHDANARRDTKMIALIAKRGTSGYGAFWIIVEMLREAETFRLPCKEYVYSAIAHETMMNYEDAKKFVFELIDEFELLKTDSDYSCFWSESLLRRMALMQEKSKQARKAALSRWSNQGKKEK